jgi:hypothetical protein
LWDPFFLPPADDAQDPHPAFHFPHPRAFRPHPSSARRGDAPPAPGRRHVARLLHVRFTSVLYGVDWAPSRSPSKTTSLTPAAPRAPRAARLPPPGRSTTARARGGEEEEVGGGLRRLQAQDLAQPLIPRPVDRPSSLRQAGTSRRGLPGSTASQGATGRGGGRCGARLRKSKPGSSVLLLHLLDPPVEKTELVH